MIEVTTRKNVVGESSGNVSFQNVCQGEAPSTRAAS